MAQESSDKERDVEEEDRSDETEEPSDSASAGSAEIVRATGDEALTEGDGSPSGEDGEDAGEEQAAAQLGTDRYVLAGFFAAGMLAAYVLGRAIQTAWIGVANKDWFSQAVPRLAAVPDDDKGMYGILLGGLLALLLVYRAYKRPDIRAWCDEVATELAKVVWPSRKEVTSSTFIVIVASTMATLYLALLDRLWAFVTNIVYGDGS